MTEVNTYDLRSAASRVSYSSNYLDRTKAAGLASQAADELDQLRRNLATAERRLRDAEEVRPKSGDARASQGYESDGSGSSGAGRAGGGPVRPPQSPSLARVAPVPEASLREAPVVAVRRGRREGRGFPAPVRWLALWRNRWLLLDLLNQVAWGTVEDAVEVTDIYGGDTTVGVELHLAAREVIAHEYVQRRGRR